MTRYTAFIRGVNGGLVMKMADLRQLFENLGYKNITTVLGTGNVIFEANGTRKQIATSIEQAFMQTYSYKTVAILYTQPELQELIERNPFKGRTKTPEASQQVSFVAKYADLPFALPYDRPEKGYVIINRIDNVVYSIVDISGKTRPDILVVLDKIFDSKVTTRNWQTVERSYKVMQESSK